MERKSDEADNRKCAVRGGAFVLVRLRIAPSFPLGGETPVSIIQKVTNSAITVRYEVRFLV